MQRRTKVLAALFVIGVLAAGLWLSGRNLAVARALGLERVALEGREGAKVVDIFWSKTGWQVLVLRKYGDHCNLALQGVQPTLLGWRLSRSGSGQVPCQGGSITWGIGVSHMGPVRYQAVAGEIRDPRVAKVTVLFYKGREVEAELGQHAYLLYEVGIDHPSTLIEIRAYDADGNLLQTIDRGYGPLKWGNQGER